ncbi:hypothetical protein HU750_03395 [Pseudomonas sp. SWRI50]|uniref:hypothetical protein n=1 Tax=Pseudomonas sp. SWRI50 TaxID=2745484 RepID=UPI0016461D89|nr:hypothetical protein [Pseudomonas sp. SWRI50]MBC3484705.1 hypothetical protein [Pseudomonas sp. SWRI50]
MTATASEILSAVELHDVYMLGCKSELTPDFHPKFAHDLADLSIETMEFIERSERFKEESGDKGLFRVFVSFGTRWKTQKLTKNKPKGKNKIDARSILGTIEGEFVVEYLIDDEITQDILDDFALKRSIDHALPYWRDHFLYQCAKLRLSTARMPSKLVSTAGYLKLDEPHGQA